MKVKLFLFCFVSVHLFVLMLLSKLKIQNFSRTLSVYTVSECFCVRLLPIFQRLHPSTVGDFPTFQLLLQFPRVHKKICFHWQLLRCHRIFMQNNVKTTSIDLPKQIPRSPHTNMRSLRRSEPQRSLAASVERGQPARIMPE